jgi:hypothetical protein
MSVDNPSLDAMGWIFYRHGKAAILVNKETTKNIFDPLSVWEGEMEDRTTGANIPIDAIAITLYTPKGPFHIVSAYIPPGVDNMSYEEETPSPPRRSRLTLWTRARIEDIHTAIHGHIAKPTKKGQIRWMICMDGNETTCKQGRLYTRTSNPSSIKNELRTAHREYTGNTRGSCTMDVYGI